jgi:hypothetical protein
MRKEASKSGKTDDVPSIFTDELLQNSKIKNVQMRMAAGGRCDTLISNLLPGQTFKIVEWISVRDVKSEDVQLAALHACDPGINFEFKALIFNFDNGQSAFAVPRSLTNQLQSYGQYYSVFPDLGRVLNLLPRSIAPFVKFSED